jgi:hypothetical protein
MVRLTIQSCGKPQSILAKANNRRSTLKIASLKNRIDIPDFEG